MPIFSHSWFGAVILYLLNILNAYSDNIPQKQNYFVKHWEPDKIYYRPKYFMAQRYAKTWDYRGGEQMLDPRYVALNNQLLEPDFYIPDAETQRYQLDPILKTPELNWWFDAELQQALAATRNPKARFRVWVGMRAETVNHVFDSGSVESGEILPGFYYQRGKRSVYRLNNSLPFYWNTLAKSRQSYLLDITKQRLDNRSRQIWRMQQLAERHGWQQRSEFIKAIKTQKDGGNNATVFTLELSRAEIDHLLEEDLDLIDSIGLYHSPPLNLSAVYGKNCPESGYVSQALALAVNNNSVLPITRILPTESSQPPQRSDCLMNTRPWLPDESAVGADKLLCDRAGGCRNNYHQTIDFIEVTPGLLNTGTVNYELSDAKWDDFVYDYGVTVVAPVSASAKTAALPSPAKALNVITLDSPEADTAELWQLNDQILNYPTTRLTGIVSADLANFVASLRPLSAKSLALADFIRKHPQFLGKPALTKALVASGFPWFEGPKPGLFWLDELDFADMHGGYTWAWNYIPMAHELLQAREQGVDRYKNAAKGGECFPNCFIVRKPIHASVTKITVSLAWLVRGEYVFNRRYGYPEMNPNYGWAKTGKWIKKYPGGIDLNLKVIDPEGNAICDWMSGFGTNQNHVGCSFDPGISGEYRFIIFPPHLPIDRAARLDFGLVVVY